MQRSPRIIGKQRLVQNGSSGSNKRARQLCLNAIERALAAIDPSNNLRDWLKVRNGQITAGKISVPTPKAIKLLSVGKASAPMAEAASRILKDFTISGILVAPKSEKISRPSERIEVFHAGHPFPDRNGLRAAREVVSLVSQMRKNELLVCLLSGGASAMLPAPPDSIPLEDKRSVTQQLVRSRATIHEINTVRRHLSKLKGGMLVERCWASMILSFIISDVPDNTLQDIASGPTAPDPTTFRDAVGVLRKYGLWDSTPRSVRLHLELGLKGKIPETPKPSNPIFRRVHNFIIADNGTACKAARDALEARQTHTRILTSSADMEAKSMGSLLGSIAKDKRRFARPVSGRSAIILGGETTVEVRGRGVGGRNQETVLSAVERIADLDGVAIAAFGTDGIDGSSAAAGAIADGNTSRRASKKYLEPAAFLASNNSYHFFKRLNDNIFTGRTGTNVGDLYLLVCTK